MPRTQRHNARELKILFVMAMFILSPLMMLWVALLINDVVEVEVAQTTEDWEDEGNYMCGYTGITYSFGSKIIHPTNLVAGVVVMDYNQIEYWYSYFIVFENMTGEAMRDSEVTGIKIEMEIYDDDEFLLHTSYQPELRLATEDGSADETLKMMDYQIKQLDSYTSLIMEAEINLVELNLVDANKIMFVAFFSYQGIYGSSTDDKIYMTYEIYGKTTYLLVSQTEIFGILFIMLSGISTLTAMVATNLVTVEELEALFRRGKAL